ncbi:MAG: histone deacetylase [Pirellulales bacterium]|jgi:acetoin utilization deacetylase AcuC-like enzyme
MRLFPSDRYELPLPPGHSFPLAKYRLLRERLEGLGTGFSFHEPQAASRSSLGRVHDAAYLERVFTGTLTPAEVRRIGFPWSVQLVERSRRSTGAAVDASRAAMSDGLAASLAGGTHHAGIAFGEGYCVFNDTAVAVRELQAAGLIRRAAILDLDVHQGNGTADIFTGDDTVFTVSVHGGRNFPLRKVASSLDIPLEDGTADEPYLEAVDQATRAAVHAGQPDLVLYIAGADPYEGDRLGRLAVSAAGLLERDRIVFDAAQRAGIPVAVVLGGGYCQDVEQTVAIHAATMLEAARRLTQPTPADPSRG